MVFSRRTRLLIAAAAVYVPYVFGTGGLLTHTGCGCLKHWVTMLWCLPGAVPLGLMSWAGAPWEPPPHLPLWAWFLAAGTPVAGTYALARGRGWRRWVAPSVMLIGSAIGALFMLAAFQA